MSTNPFTPPPQSFAQMKTLLYTPIIAKTSYDSMVVQHLTVQYGLALLVLYYHPLELHRLLRTDYSHPLQE